MKNKLVVGFLLVFVITGCFNSNLSSNNNDESSDNDMNKVKSINVIIDNKSYVASLEDNDTVSEFVKLLPLEFNMNELNGNEKYFYMNDSLPVNQYSPKHIEAGDIMLYGDNCLVLFYKSFDTSYSYTKIGHIDNLSDISSGSVIVKFSK